MVVFNIPIPRARRLLSDADRLKAKKAREARTVRAARAARAARADNLARRTGTRAVPLNIKLAKFASRPLNPAADSSQKPTINLEQKAAWWKLTETADQKPKNRAVKAKVAKPLKPLKLVKTAEAVKATEAAEATEATVATEVQKGPNLVKETSKVLKTREPKELKKVLLRIEPKDPKKINKGEIAQFNKNNVKTATILRPEGYPNDGGVGPSPSLNRTLKVTGLTEAELNKALKIAAAKTKNTILKDLTKNMIKNQK